MVEVWFKADCQTEGYVKPQYYSQSSLFSLCQHYGVNESNFKLAWNKLSGDRTGSLSCVFTAWHGIHL